MIIITWLKIVDKHKGAFIIHYRLYTTQYAGNYIQNFFSSAVHSGHDIGHWPAGPTAIFSRRASRATSMHFLLARWATRQQIGPPVGLEDTGPTPLVALFAKPTQTTDSHQCIAGYLSPWGCSAWLCLALSLMTQLTAQSIMWLPDTVTRLECIVYSAKWLHSAFKECQCASHNTQCIFVIAFDEPSIDEHVI